MDHQADAHQRLALSSLEGIQGLYKARAPSKCKISIFKERKPWLASTFLYAVASVDVFEIIAEYRLA